MPSLGDNAISPRLARLVARILAVLLIGTGLAYRGLLLMARAGFLVFSGRMTVIDTFRPTLTGIVFVVAGVAIFLRRSWGYYIAYCVMLVSLLSTHGSLLPLPFTVNRWLWLHVGFPDRLTYGLFDLLFAGAVVSSHYALFRTGQLRGALHFKLSRRGIRVCEVLSGIAIIVPVLLFVGALVKDPPGTPCPGDIGAGGWLPFLVVYFTWPIVVVGIIGMLVCRWLSKNTQRSGKEQSPPLP
jgi:hypothetical protein